MQIREGETAKFATSCLAKAFDENGDLKDDFQCKNEDDFRKAEAEIMAF